MYTSKALKRKDARTFHFSKSAVSTLFIGIVLCKDKNSLATTTNAKNLAVNVCVLQQNVSLYGIFYPEYLVFVETEKGRKEDVSLGYGLWMEKDGSYAESIYVATR